MDARQIALTLSGRQAVSVAEDPMLHVEGDPGVTLCGEPVESYPLHWDVPMTVGCGLCLMRAGVPMHGYGELRVAGD